MSTVKHNNKIKIGDRESKNKIRYRHDKTFPNEQMIIRQKDLLLRRHYEMLVNIYKMHYNNTN